MAVTHFLSSSQVFDALSALDLGAPVCGGCVARLLGDEAQGAAML